MNLMQCLLIKYFFTFSVLQNIFVNARVPIPEDALLSSRQIVEKFGHQFEEYDVTTEDGYILKIFHITGEGTPVLIAHGLLATADCFVLRSQTSAAIALADKGYDVWLINLRGGIFSRRHKTLNPDKDKAFWDFSFEEMGTKDLPATIDFVLGKTGKSQIPVIGHSQGTQIFFVLGSLKPEYNAKISIFIALAPVAYLHHIPPPFSLLIPLWLPISANLLITGKEELFNGNSTFLQGYKALCGNNSFSEAMCRAVFFAVAGYDPAEFEQSFMPVVVEKFPTSTSRRNLDHMAQIFNRKKFSRYDYGLGNLLKYGTLQPPDYPVEKMKTRVALLVGKNDLLATVADVKLLKARLPNVIYHEMENEKCNHIDLVWGKHMDEYLFPHIFNLLETGELT